MAITRVELVAVGGGQPYVLALPMVLVGSKSDCDIRIEGEGVPAMCCVVALTDDLVLLRDLDTDAIRVNGQRLRRAVLLPDDRLSIGSREFLVRYECPLQLGGP